jgi:glycyl-tRNA synthetase beta subunit
MTQTKRKTRGVTMEEFWTPRRIAILRRDLIEDPVMTMEEKISWSRAIAKALGRPHAKSDLESPPRKRRVSAHA